MPSALATSGFILVVALGAWSCADVCEEACKDELDDCVSEPANPERPLACDRQYDHCLAVCTSRPQHDEPSFEE